MNASVIHESPQTEKIREAIEKNRNEQKRCQMKIVNKIQNLIQQDFAFGLLDELEELENEEMKIEVEYLKLLSELFDQQKERRVQFLNEKRKAQLSSGSSANRKVKMALKAKEKQRGELFDSTVDISQKIFGSSTTKRSISSTLLRKQGQNPFEQTSNEPTVTDQDDGSLDYDLQIKASEIEVTSTKLGTGAFGVVYVGKLRGRNVAVKTLKPNWNSGSAETIEAAMQDFIHECALMRKATNPNILMLMGVCIEQQGKDVTMMMVTEIMENGSVYDIIHGEKKVSFKQRMKFANDAVSGMTWLHAMKPPVLHLDLKTKNLLVDKNMVVKVADFGLSRMKTGKKTGAVGSPSYMAPEMLSEKEYDEKADVYSFAICLWELLTQGKPHADIEATSLDEIYKYVVIQKKRPTIPPQTPTQLSQLLTECWHDRPEERPSFKQIIDSHILDNVILDAIFSNPANREAKTFWKDSFGHKDVISWKKFIRTMVKWCGITFVSNRPLDDQIEIKALKIVLVTRKEDVVTMEDFSNILEWFGPFTKNTEFLENVTRTVSMRGFFGDILTKDAERMMAGRKPGNYMIRFSGQQPGYYTITSMTSENVLKHYRIKHKAGLGYVLGNKEYPTLARLLVSLRQDLFLKYSVKGSKYAQMFIEHRTDLSSAYLDMNELEEGLERENQKSS